MQTRADFGAGLFLCAIHRYTARAMDSDFTKREDASAWLAEPPEPRMSWRMWQFRRCCVVALFPLMLSGLFVMADQSYLLLARDADDVALYHGKTLQVTRVLSATILEVDQPDAATGATVTRIRLWGVSLPRESADRDADTAIALQAEARVRALIASSDNMLTLAIEPHRTRDPQNNVMVHALLADGRSISEMLLREGWVGPDERRPHRRLVEYAQATQVARAARRGRWR